jgi:hypothetical protein
MAEKAKADKALRIREQDDGILLHPDDDDLFVRTGRQIIAACRLKIDLDTWLSEFAAVRKHVDDWIRERASERVVACYYLDRARVTFVFVVRGDEFDFELADLLAPLSATLLREYNVGMIELGQISQTELGRFLDPTQAKLVYGS